jgi:hypothetical protein
MNARKSISQRFGFALLFVVLLSTGLTSKATSIRFPKFSAPVLAEDRLIFTSVDSKRLLCVSLKGKLLWEQKYETAIRLFTGPKSEPLLQIGTAVSSVLPESGELRARFAVEDKNDAVTFSRDIDSFISHARRFGSQTFKLLDGTTGRPLWRKEDLEKLIGGTPQQIVCLVARPIPRGAGFTFGSAFLNSYDRKTFASGWSLPIYGGSFVLFLRATFNAPYLIFTDAANSLTVLECTTGHKRLTRRMDVSSPGYISDLQIHGDQLVWLSGNTLHFCTIPELNEVKSLFLQVAEVSRVSFEGGFIISDALYRTACFRPTGEKVWERNQTERTRVIKDRIYFSDYQKKTARLGWVEVPTGKEEILYSEKIEASKFTDQEAESQRLGAASDSTGTHSVTNRPALGGKAAPYAELKVTPSSPNAVTNSAKIDLEALQSRLFVVITNRAASDEELLQAISSLGKVTEPPSFWTAIADDKSYSIFHRRRAVFALFRRHCRAGDLMSDLRKKLAPGHWLDESYVRAVEATFGQLDSPIMPEPGMSLFRVSVLYGASVYFLLQGEYDPLVFSSMIHGESRGRFNALIHNVAFDDDYDDWFFNRKDR